jgi:hypothetical protein
MKKLKYILSGLVLVLLFFVSCEEYYNPDLEETPGLMVVESHLTNDPNQNFVKLSKALNFYTNGHGEEISGAKVDLLEIGGTKTRAIESTTGYFTFPNTPVPGKKYMLQITYLKDIYESVPVIMPPLPNIDTIYTNHKVEKSYRTDVLGGPQPIENPGREICIDAPITPLLEYYRFNCHTILQWVVPPPPIPFGPPPLYGWKSFYDNGVFNIAGPKQFSVSDQVKNHPLKFLGYDYHTYLDSDTQIAAGWILIIDEYGISKESYDFHEQLNKQLSAEGSLFDPVLMQVTGNIRCITDSKKIVLGFFDLNSYRQYRYFFYFGQDQSSKVNQRQITRYLEIPGDGSQYGVPPIFWENM